MDDNDGGDDNLPPHAKRMRIHEQIHQLFTSTFGVDDEDERLIEDSAKVIIDHIARDEALGMDIEKGKWGGSSKGKTPNKERDFEGAYRKMIIKYFSGEDSVCSEEEFERRFKMPRRLFKRIYETVLGKKSFVQNYDATKKPGISPLCRLVAVLRHLSYDHAVDREDDYLDVSESTLFISCRDFFEIIMEEFGPEYLYRCPSIEEKEEASLRNAHRGFPGTFASWDCKMFPWQIIPVRVERLPKNHHGKPKIFLETIVDPDLYIWYVYLGELRYINDVNALCKNSIVQSLLNQTFDSSTEEYTLNGTTRDHMTFLVNDLYPEWSLFIPTYSDPQNNEEEVFAKAHQGAHRDIERAYRIMAQKFQILERPVRKRALWETNKMFQTCVILYNMINRDKRDHVDFDDDDDDDEERYFAAPTPMLEELKNVDDIQLQFRLFSYAAQDMATEGGDEVQFALQQRSEQVAKGIADAEEHFKLLQESTAHVTRMFPE